MPGRNVHITLGPNSYVLNTTLSPLEFENFRLFALHVYDSTAPKYTHEQRLVLGWLKMAWQIQKTQKELQTMLDVYGAPADTFGKAPVFETPETATATSKNTLNEDT